MQAPKRNNSWKRKIAKHVLSLPPSLFTNLQPSTSRETPKSRRREKSSARTGKALWGFQKSSQFLEYDYIVLGGGTSAGYFARAFIDRGQGHGKLAIISPESFPPYEKDSFMQGFLNGTEEMSDLFTCTASGKEPQGLSWYTKNGIAVYLKTEISSVDENRKIIVTSTGSQFMATKGIIIASGSISKRISVIGKIYESNSNQEVEYESLNSENTYEGLFYISSADDAVRLRYACLVKNKTENTCIVIGSGKSTIECVATLSQMGFSVTMIVAGDSIADSFLTPQVSLMYEEYLNNKGIRVIKGKACQSVITQNGIVTGCRLDTNEVILGNLIAVDIGTKPNISLWEKKLSLQLNVPYPAILVDSMMKTNVQGIYAIGGAASLPFFMFEQSQLEHHSLAFHTANYLVDILYGKTSQLYCHPHIQASPFEFKWNMWGDKTGSQNVVFGTIQEKLVSIWLWEGRILGAFMQSGDETEHSMLLNATKCELLVDLKRLKAIQTTKEFFNLLSSTLALSLN